MSCVGRKAFGTSLGGHEPRESAPKAPSRLDKTDARRPLGYRKQHHPHSRDGDVTTVRLCAWRSAKVSDSVPSRSGQPSQKLNPLNIDP